MIGDDGRPKLHHNGLDNRRVRHGSASESGGARLEDGRVLKELGVAKWDLVAGVPPRRDEQGFRVGTSRTISQVGAVEANRQAAST